MLYQVEGPVMPFLILPPPPSPLICTLACFLPGEPDLTEHDNMPVGHAGTGHNTICCVSFELRADRVSAERRSF